MSEIPTFEMRPKFTDLIDKLAKPGGLLTRLQEAVFGGMESTGGTSAFGSKPPIDVAAVDLEELISQQAAEALATVNPTPTPLGRAADYVASWGRLAREDDIVTVFAPALTVDQAVYRRGIQMSAYRHAERWVAMVENFFQPPRDAQVMHACPNCGMERISKLVEGETVLDWALVMQRDRETSETIGVLCQACTYEWPRRHLALFADLIGIDVQAVIAQELTK